MLLRSLYTYATDELDLVKELQNLQTNLIENENLQQMLLIEWREHDTMIEKLQKILLDQIL